MSACYSVETVVARTAWRAGALHRRAFGLGPVPAAPSRPFGFNPSCLRACGAARFACLQGKALRLSPLRGAWRPSILPNRLAPDRQVSAKGESSHLGGERLVKAVSGRPSSD